MDIHPRAWLEDPSGVAAEFLVIRLFADAHQLNTWVRKHKDSQADVPSGLGQRQCAGSVGAIDEALSRRRSADERHECLASGNGPSAFPKGPRPRPYPPEYVEGVFSEVR